MCSNSTLNNNIKFRLVVLKFPAFQENLLFVVSIVLSTMDFISLHSILLDIFSLACYVAWVASYRLYLSPIAKFPGPKLAALTFWYELYHDLIRPGQYAWEIAKMHEQYGKIYLITSIDLACRFSCCKRTF